MGKRTAAARCGLKRLMTLHILATVRSISDVTAGTLPLQHMCTEWVVVGCNWDKSLNSESSDATVFCEKRLSVNLNDMSTFGNRDIFLPSESLH